MATYEDLLKTCSNQQQIINELSQKLKDLEARQINYGQFQITTKLNGKPRITLPMGEPESIQTFSSDVEFCTDEEELEKEFPEIQNNKKKRKRTLIKTPPEPYKDGKEKKIEHKLKKPPLPPPINVSNVHDFKLLRDAVLDTANDQVQFKAQSNSDIKITTKSEEDYRKIKSMLNDLKLKDTEENPNTFGKLEYHTYQLKNERPYRVVIRGLPATLNPSDIKAAIEEKGHQVKNVLNIYKKSTIDGNKVVKHFPLFYVDISQKDNNKDIFNITELLNCVVKMEPTKKVRGIPQCTNCQQLGHTKNFCMRRARCVKCAGAHHYKECKKQPGTAPTCALCNQKGHTANYKGCEVYQKKLKAQNPEKITVARRLQDKPAVQQQTDEPSTSGLTYAQASQKPIAKQNQDNKQDKTSKEPTISDLMRTLSQYQNDIKQSLCQLADRVEKLENIFNAQGKQVNKKQNV